MNEKEMTWEEFRKKLNITPEEEEEIKLEREVIETFIKARKERQLSQRELSEKSGIKQPAIARIERGHLSPRVETLMRLLYSMGYTLKVVPLNKEDK